MANHPNHYHVHGGGLNITYTTSGFDGKPHFAYQDGTRVLNFSGDEIKAEPTEIGTLVSVVIFRTIDAGSTTFTLLVPHVNLDQTNQAHIVTEGITTIQRFSIFPLADLGQTQLYTVTCLTGSARFVVF